MKSEFPIKEPTHYVACIDNPITGACTHASVKLSAPTLGRLAWMWFVSFALRLVGVKAAVFQVKPDKLGLDCLRVKSRATLKPGQECSVDEDPYNCLSLGELIALGGYANETVLKSAFSPSKLQLESVELVVIDSMVGFKLNFSGTNPSLETDTFNLKVIVQDIIHRLKAKGASA